MGEVFLRAMVGERWDLGGLTFHIISVWLLRKWGGKRGDGNCLGCWVFFFPDLVSRMKLKSLLNYVNYLQWGEWKLQSKNFDSFCFYIFSATKQDFKNLEAE